MISRLGRMSGVAAAALFVFFVLTGCGYQVVGQGSLPEGITALCVEVPENRSSDVKLAPVLGDYIVARMVSGGVSAGVGCSNGAHLYSEIRSVVTSTVSRNSAGEGIEERVAISGVFRLSSVDGEVVWRSGVITGDETYSVVPGGDSTPARDAALDEAADRLAEALWSAMTQRF
ncbi:MAG: hypothetical protein MI742_07865 [Desulfobacterales bacterium]|nr:hypothetical protein [Desulfobacterales bacterium]